MKSQASMWLASPVAQRVFQLTAFLVCVGVVSMILLGAVMGGSSVVFADNNHRLEFWLFFIAAAVLLCANVTIWLGIICVVLFLDKRPVAARLLWIAVLMVGVSWTATVYYFLRYRKMLPSSASRTQTLHA